MYTRCLLFTVDRTWSVFCFPVYIEHTHISDNLIKPIRFSSLFRFCLAATVHNRCGGGIWHRHDWNKLRFLSKRTKKKTQTFYWNKFVPPRTFVTEWKNTNGSMKEAAQSPFSEVIATTIKNNFFVGNTLLLYLLSLDKRWRFRFF